MTATDLDLDALLDALLERAVARAEARPLINVAGQEVGAPGVQAGRLQVNPGDTIQSAWGNATYDQTVQQYATVADRTAQWPTPADGAMSYTVDQAILWVRRAGAWQAVPRGFVASGLGPSTQTDYGASAGIVATVSAALTAGRRYRVGAGASGNQQTATGNPSGYVQDSASLGPAWRCFSTVGLPTNQWTGGAGAWVYTGTGATVTFTLYATSTAGVLRIPVNNGQIFIEDIGG